MRHSLAQHRIVRFACMLWLFAAYGIAVAADAPGWLLLFDASRGVFPGANRVMSGMSRPSWNSIMRYGDLFDAVARRTLDARLQKLLRADAAPTTGNWYDRRRAGHGIDLQRYRRDPAGDICFIVFYTYGQNGVPEWFQGLGRLNGDVLLPIADANGKTLTRVRGSGQGTPDSALSGDYSIEFRRTADCKTDDRADAQALAAMQWSIGG